MSKEEDAKKALKKTKKKVDKNVSSGNKPNEVVKNKPKKKSFDFKKISNNKFVLIGGFLGLFLAVAMIILAFVQPVIEVDKEAEKVEFENLLINTETGYPKFKFDSPQKLKLAKGDEIITKTYSSKDSDFGEGKNVVYNNYFLDLFFIKFEGKDTNKTLFTVDRTKPTLELLNDLTGSVYFSNQSTELELSSETGAELFANNSSLGKFVQDQQKFEVPIVSGNNKIEFYSVDTNGNQSDIITTEFEAVEMNEFDSGDGFFTKIIYPSDWKIEVRKESEMNKSMYINLTKGNAALKYDFAALIWPTGFNSIAYCTNNSQSVHKAEGDYVRIEPSNKQTENIFLYKFVEDYTETENNKSSSEDWVVLFNDWDHDSSWEKDLDGIVIDHTGTAEDYNFCVSDLDYWTKWYSHGFQTEGSTPVAWYTATVEFDGEIDQQLLKEADSIVSMSTIGE